MDDVIFSGTTKLLSMQMVEVSLIIQNDKGKLPGGHTHIMITRQVYRSGESGYLINGQACRLKDIQHLFYDTGMGAASYSLMEAKMIDSVLSDKDEERRVLFEEACGISKYKKQRAETKRQLDRTAIDLDRVDDNLKHTKQSVNMFERQANKAEKWKILNGQIRNLEISYQVDQYTEIKDRYQGLVEQRDTYRRRLEEIEIKRTTEETILQKKRLEVVEDEEQLSEVNQIVSNTKALATQVSNDIQRVKDRVHYLEESVLKQKGSKSETAQKIAGYIEEKHALILRLKGCKAELEEIQVNLSDLENASEKKSLEYKEQREKANSLSSDRMEFLEEFTGWKNNLNKLKMEQTSVSQRLEDLEVGFGSEETEIEGYREEKIRLDEQYSIDMKELSGVENSHQELEEKVQQIKVLAEEAGIAFRKGEKEKITLETESKLLKSMHDSMEGVNKGTQYLLKNASEQIDSVLADKLKVPEEYAAMVERCIGESLQVLVVKEEGNISSLIDELLNFKKGEALFYKTGVSQFSRSRVDLSQRTGFKCWLIDTIEIEESLRPLLESLIGQYVLVDSLGTAENWAQELGQEDIWMVTPEGFLLHSSGLTQGGSQGGGNSGLLQQKARLETLTKQLHSVIEKYDELEIQMTSHQESLKELEEDLISSRIRLQQLNSSTRDFKGKLSVIESKLESYDFRKQQNAEKEQQFQESLDALEPEIEALELEVDEKEEWKNTLDNQFSQTQDELLLAEEEKNKYEITLRERQNKVQQLKAERDKIEQRQEHLEQSEQEHLSIQIKMDLEGEEWGEAIQENQSKAEQLTDQLHEINERLMIEVEARDRVKAVYDDKTVGMDENRNAIQVLNKEYNEVSRNQHGVEIKIEQNSSHLRQMEERMYELYEVNFESDELEYERVEYIAEEVEAELRELKSELKKLGNVNVGALEDYEQEKLHLEDVQKQYDDLENARAGLDKAIRKLDQLARKQFLETFEIIRKNFQDIFTTLFHGGQAQLNLEQDVDPLEAKIEINSAPSGKKMKGVTLLSGGERALTAISLLFSLYLVKTSPYCVMDEVDGPLDDANIGRFVELLRRFSNQTQFLVVTHNKRTMAASDMLYGVTQEVKGISQLASVKLDEASLIAA